MSNKDNKSNDDKDSSQSTPMSSIVPVVLPCPPENFRDFIAGLLGRPQTISKALNGTFELKREDIESFYHLVDQRVSQQNGPGLVQFTVTINFDDGSSVLLNNLDDFIAYNEVRPVASTSLHLSWTYLLQFKDRAHPEKQQIDVSFHTEAGPFFRFDGIRHAFISPSSSMENGVVTFRIQHTARTWGADMESLLTNHIKNLFSQVSPVKSFIRSRSDDIGLAGAAFLFLGSLIGGLITASKFAESQLDKVAKLKTGAAADISVRVDNLLDLIAAGAWPRFVLELSLFFVAALVVSIFIGIWIGQAASNHEPSFLLLTKDAERKKAATLESLRNKWYSFAAAIIVDIIIGVTGNMLFARFVQGG